MLEELTEPILGEFNSKLRALYLGLVANCKSILASAA